jgi:ferredoxin
MGPRQSSSVHLSSRDLSLAGLGNASGGVRMRKLVVDWIACDGHALCALAAPELIDLDDWGYPIVHAIPDDNASLLLARAAVEACPVMALRIEKSK